MSATITQPQVIDIETLLPWGPAKEVKTKLGPKLLRKAAPTPAFDALWDNPVTQKQLRNAGISVGLKWKSNTEWEVCHWGTKTAAMIEAEKKVIEASRAVSSDIEILIPEGLSLMPFQRAGVAMMMTRKNNLLADEMGLGKTVQAICIINMDPTIKKVLVVCPNSVKVNWKREMDKWLVVPRKVEVCDAKHFNPNAEVAIINWDVLTKHDFPTDYDLLISDECHYAQNSKALRTKAWLKIKARRLIDATGTPMLNRPLNALTILNHLEPDRFKWWGYTERYCGPKQVFIGMKLNPKTGLKEATYARDVTGASNLDELQAELRKTVMTRRLKTEVLTELPPKFRQIIELPANGNGKLVSKLNAAAAPRIAIMEELQAKLELAKVTENQADYEKVLATLEKQTAIMFEEMASARAEIGMAKVPYAIEHINTLLDQGTDKVILFAHHINVIDALHAAFPTFAKITGATDASLKIVQGKETNDRQLQVDRFQNDPECLGIICQDQAAAEGITLTASQLVVFVELDWVPGKIMQREDRAHRIGQKGSVLIQFLAMEGSVDAIMAENLVWKMNVIDRALDRKLDLEELYKPVAPVKTVTITKSELKQSELIPMSKETVAAIHTCLKILAGLDGDFAAQRNGIGFSGCDTHIGHAFADANYLSPKMSALGAKIVKKYHKQLPAEIYSKATGQAKA